MRQGRQGVALQRCVVRSLMRDCLRLWLTCLVLGMAMRLSFNLALHQDLKPYVAKGAVTAAEADLRRTVFWAAFVVDQ
jgi:hypothetical protein